MKRHTPGRSTYLSLAFAPFLAFLVVVTATAHAQAGRSPGLFSAAHAANGSLSSDPWVQFVQRSINMYAISLDSMDQGSPMVPLYTNLNAGGTYGLPDSFHNVAIPDGNDPDAPPGFISSYLMSWSGVGENDNAYFQFDISCNIANRPRNIPNFGLAHNVWFYAKGLSANLQLEMLVFEQVPLQGGTCTYMQVASYWFPLTTGWEEYALDISSAMLGPQQLFAVQFLVNPAHDPSSGSLLLADVRIDTDGYDPLRGIQSYIPHWAPTNSPPNTPGGRDVNIYPNRSYLYDDARAIHALLLGGDIADAENIADGRMATTNYDCTNGFHNEQYSGHTLQADGTPHWPSTLMRKRLGDNSWFGLALLELYQATGSDNSNYLNCAQSISDWVNTNFKDTSGTLEGYTGGSDDNGQPLPSRSVEENADYFELNQQLATFFGSTYAARATWAGNFVINMYCQQSMSCMRGGLYFWAGTTNLDNINTQSIPLDAQTLPLLTLGMSQQYQNAVDYAGALRWADANLMVTDSNSMPPLTGFTYSTQSAMQSCSGMEPPYCPRVWLEGVAQGCVAYELLARLEQKSTDPWGAKVQQCLQTLENASMNGTGVLAASSDNLVDPAFIQYYDARQAIAPTAWAAEVGSLLGLK